MLTIAGVAVLLAGCGSSSPSTSTFGASVEAQVKQQEQAQARTEKEDLADETVTQTPDEIEHEEQATLERQARARADRVRHLFAHHAAVGMRLTAVKRQLGAPSHTQDVEGHVYWYYEQGESEYQLLTSGGVVTGVNRY